MRHRYYLEYFFDKAIRGLDQADVLDYHKEWLIGHIRKRGKRKK